MSPPNRKADPVAVCELRLAGWKLEAIAAQFGITRQRVDQITRERGAHAPRSPAKPPEPRKLGAYGNIALEDRNKEILRLYEQGLGTLAIQTALGLTRGQVSGTLDRLCRSRRKPTFPRSPRYRGC